MIDRARLSARLQRKEELRLKVYDDETGKEIGPGSTLIGHPTIGIGRALDVEGISPIEARFLNSNDIDSCLQAASNFAWFGELDPVRQETILEMIFNLGIERFLGFQQTIAAIARKDFTEAASQMLSSIWAGQVGNRARELSEMMRTGVHNPG